MICPKCYKYYPDSKEYCPYCGQNIKEAQVEQFNSKGIQKNYNKDYKEPSIFDGAINHQTVWFKVFKFLPLVISILSLIAVIVVSLSMCTSDYSSEVEMGIKTLFLGIIGVVIEFCVLKITLAPLIIKIECLMKLANYDK